MDILSEKFNWHQIPHEENLIVRTGTPILSGRLTDGRIKLIESGIEKVNYELSAPYGRSERGYAYTCGCMHDCCGHLHSDRITLVLEQVGFGSDEYNVHLERKKMFNY